MTSDLNIYRSANLLVKRHSQDAPIKAIQVPVIQLRGNGAVSDRAVDAARASSPPRTLLSEAVEALNRVGVAGQQLDHANCISRSSQFTLQPDLTTPAAFFFTFLTASIIWVLVCGPLPVEPPCASRYKFTASRICL